MSTGLKPILKLGVPVRGLRPPNDASVRPVRGGSPLPRSISLFLHTKLLGVHAHNPRTPWRLLDGPIAVSSTRHLHPPPMDAPCAPRSRSSHPPHPTPLHAGGALGCRHRIDRLLPPVRGLAAADLADAVRRLEGLVRASTPRQTRLRPPHRPPPILTPPPHPDTARLHPSRGTRAVAPSAPAAPLPSAAPPLPSPPLPSHRLLTPPNPPVTPPHPPHPSSPSSPLLTPPHPSDPS